jgi:hypothetical protein
VEIMLSLEGSALLSPICGITKEIMSRGPKVTDMECQESTWPTVSICTDGDPSHQHRGHRFSDGIHHTS